LCQIVSEGRRFVTPDRVDELFDRYPEHLSVPELADVLGIKRTTAYKWLQGGIVPAYKVGGAWVILRDEVRDWLKAGRNVPPQSGEVRDPGK
jgi:excisionase family DNA binding protein